MRNEVEQSSSQGFRTYFKKVHHEKSTILTHLFRGPKFTKSHVIQPCFAANLSFQNLAYQNFCQIFRRLAPLLLATRKVNIQQPTEIKRK